MSDNAVWAEIWMKTCATSIVLGTSLLWAAASLHADEPIRRPIVGAIRWDAWHGPASEVGLIVEKALAPKRWHYRLPFYAKVVGENAVEVRANTQAIMDQEIEYAGHAGLDYWAFVVYPEEDALSLGLKLYLSSEKKQQVKFCLNLQGGWEARGGRKVWPEKVNRYVQYFQEPTYQTVLGGRPLLYVYSIEALIGEGLFRDWNEARAAFQWLRDATTAQGLPTPYIVAQGWSPEVLQDQREKLGFDAIGAYASTGGERAAPYSALAAHTERWWNAFKTTGCEVVPLVTAGWDMRPRIETRVPWVKDGDINQYYEPARPEELEAHLQKAAAWCKANTNAARSQTLLIYAWNEFDEGGWICPTLTDGTARLDALRSVLRPHPPR